MRRVTKDCILSILGELLVALLLAALTPFLIRYIILPNSVNQQYPLNVVFHTCDHDLHSVCSFPSATIDYEKNELFSPNVVYYLNVQLKFADLASSKMLGLFQNVITIHDENGKIIKQYTRSSYIKEPGMLTKSVHLFFFPLYLFGFFHDYNTLNIPLTADYSEFAATPSHKLVYTLQDKFANIEDANLIVTARFGLIRHLLYYWPTTSTFIIFLSTFVCFISLIIAKLAYINFKQENRNTNEDVNELDTISPAANHKKTKILDKNQKVHNFADDEYVPDNYNETPEDDVLFVNFSSDTNASQNGEVRKRKGSISVK